MEPRLGADLDSVRVHTGSESADAARGFGARAFTVGGDVHFNSGEFQPGTKEGDKLIAHELTHVVQGQKAGVQRKAEADDAKPDEKEGVEVSDPDEPAEKEADAVADEMAGEEADEEKEAGDKPDEKSDKTKGPDEKEPKVAAKLEGIGAKIMRADDTKKTKAIGDIKAKAGTFANFKCVECADALKAILVAAGIKGSVVRLTNKPQNKNGFVYCISKNMNVSASNFHVGVCVDGVVYDNHHAGGIARGAWVADFAHMMNPGGGAGAFDISDEAF